MNFEVSELEALMRDAQRRLDVARVAADRKEALENEQIDILTRDLNDANRRVAHLEAELGRMAEELAEARASSQRGGLEDIAALGGLMKEKDELIARLTEENQRLVEAAAVEAKKARTQCDEMAVELEKRAHQMKQFEALLADQSDYEAIKKELRLLREIEFGEAATANEDSIARLGETVQSLDKLLAAKNRRLQNDNAQLRQANELYQGDEIMQAILAGSHQAVVEVVSTRVGREVAEGYVDANADHIRHLPKPDNKEPERAKSDPDDRQNLFKILMNMGSVPAGGSRAENGSATSRGNNTRSPSTEIPFEHFRYSPKLTNYTGEPAKTPQELKAIQDLQARNVRALGSRALNTAEIARQCKRLMVAYNIGQRLFAKYVMNQSQGSLSELLSKPRHWSKLTDKGREAFRRIYGWISDAEAVDLLCSLSPRRVWPSEVRIEHPTPESLWEGNSGMVPPDEPDENSFKRAASAREDQYRLAGTNQAANAGSTTRNSRWRHDDIPKEKIMSIFQTELAKLREQLEDTSPSYHEMSHNERMASISHAHQVMSTRMRVGLSPITQEQFEMFGHIDTDDVVKQIKEFLSMNSISQRQFGEHVLGLSQVNFHQIPTVWKPFDYS
ncbi:CUT domain protein [Cooperia oncophora]